MGSDLCDVMWSGVDCPVGVASSEDLEELLLNIDARARTAGRPEMVQLKILITGSYLMVGLGAHVSVLSYVSGSQMPPYWVSDSGGDESGVLEYEFGGQPSEFDARSGIETAMAIRACREFCGYGDLPDNVAWEEV